MSQGWIKLYRKFIDWEWYEDTNCVRLFLHCLLKANHREKEWRGNTIPRGTFITSYRTLSAETGLSEQQLRTAFAKLEKTGEINRRPTALNTWVTIAKYDDYQNVTDEPTKEQRRTNEVATTTNNEKNEKNNITKAHARDEEYHIPSVEEVEDYFQERGEMIPEDIPLEAENFFNHYEENDWKTNKGKGSRIKHWKKQAATWINNYKKFNRKRLKNAKQSSKQIAERTVTEFQKLDFSD